MTSHHAVLVAVAALVLAAPGSYAGRNSALASAEEIYNVRVLGARGNGKTNDTPAIRSVIKSAPDGAIIYFPPGNYRCHGLTVTDRERLTFQGAGPGSVIEAPDAARNPTILNLDQCRDIVLRDLTFDTHATNITALAVSNSETVRIRNCKFTAAAPQQSAGVHLRNTTNLWFAKNLVEQRHVEHQQLKRARFSDNIFSGPTRFGIVMLAAAGSSCELLTIEDNIFDGMTTAAIGIWDPASGSARIRDVKIRNNQIACPTVTAVPPISVGQIRGKSATKSVWKNITIAGNSVHFTGPATTSHIIAVGGARTKSSYTGFVIRDNDVTGGGGKQSGILLQGLTDALVIGNSVAEVGVGIVLGSGSKRCLVVDNRVSTISDTGYRLEKTAGENVMVGNHCVGKIPVPYDFEKKQANDRVERTNLLRLR
ncbi:MAG: glycosyl hydrolase family 28-related protein [Lentisphaeria bacterium]|jgi:hypothetical protein|nr:glycosyl hydrolase family 28-related protein [Lentisphaeria bacterium]MDP7741356.1 glycosyl hydrolase family 28-related protein [Lentisphaeria bacterium]